MELFVISDNNFQRLYNVTRISVLIIVGTLDLPLHFIIIVLNNNIIFVIFIVTKFFLTRTVYCFYELSWPFGFVSFNFLISLTWSTLRVFGVDTRPQYYYLASFSYGDMKWSEIGRIDIGQTWNLIREFLYCVMFKSYCFLTRDIEDTFIPIYLLGCWQSNPTQPCFWLKIKDLLSILSSNSGSTFLRLLGLITWHLLLLFNYLYLFVYLFIYLFTYLFIYLFICLFIYLITFNKFLLPTIFNNFL